MYRGVLVALKPERPNDVLISYAIDLATQYSLRLVGIAVLDKMRIAPPESVPLGSGTYKSRRDQELIQQTREQIGVQLRAFSTHCQKAGIVCEVVSEEGDISKVIAATLQHCDLLMVGHTPGTVIGDGTSVPSPLHDIVKHCPRPALVVPGHRPNGPNVLVAYDGSLQAARALEAFVASGWLRDAEVHVLAFAATDDIAQQHVNSAMDYLRPHGLNLVAHAKVNSQSPAEGIPRAVEETSAGLLVMGCYGRSAFREFIFGSVTRSVLKAATFPILLDH